MKEREMILKLHGLVILMSRVLNRQDLSIFTDEELRKNNELAKAVTKYLENV